MTRGDQRPRRSVIAAHPLISAGIAILLAADIFFALYTPIYARHHAEDGATSPSSTGTCSSSCRSPRLVLWLVTLLQKRLATPATDPEEDAGEQRQRHHVHDRRRPLPHRHRRRLRRRPLAPPGGHDAPRRVGPRRAAASARSSPGSCSAATSTRPTRSSRCPRWSSAPARSASTRSRTRSWSSRSCSSSCPGCGRSPGCTATSPRPTSSAAATGPAAWRWRPPSPGSWR